MCVQLLFVLGIPPEVHVKETDDGRCGVSTTRHAFLVRRQAPARTRDCLGPAAEFAGRGSS
jgi:hypothetical protein